MPFYTYSQNNSGGVFYGPEYVIIEARDAREANMRAVCDTDIYFDGCDKGWDCPCCGDRWHPAEDLEATEKPSIYGNEDILDEVFNGIRSQAVIYYLNGDVVFIGAKRGGS